MLLSYAIACQKYKDAATAEKVKAYLATSPRRRVSRRPSRLPAAAPLSEKLSADVEAAVATIS